MQRLMINKFNFSLVLQVVGVRNCCAWTKIHIWPVNVTSCQSNWDVCYSLCRQRDHLIVQKTVSQCCCSTGSIAHLSIPWPVMFASKLRNFYKLSLVSQVLTSWMAVMQLTRHRVWRYGLPNALRLANCLVRNSHDKYRWMWNITNTGDLIDLPFQVLLHTPTNHDHL